MNKVVDKKQVLKYLSKAGPLVALVILSIILSFVTEYFFTMRNLMNVLRQAAALGLMALGMLIVIITAGIDLSVGSILAFAGVSMAILNKYYGVNPLLAILICIVVGAFLGFTNGILLTKLRLPHPFIATIGTMKIFRGIVLIITLGAPVSGLDKQILWIGEGSIGPIPAAFLFLIVIAVLTSFFLNRTILGRHIYAVGGNPLTAKLSGVNTGYVLIATYTLSGLLTAFSAIVLAGRVDSVSPLAGTGWELDAIASVILGGASFFGGKGNVLGTLSGVLLITVIRNGMNLLNIRPDAQDIVLGSVIIFAVFIDVVRSGGFQKGYKKKKIMI